MVRIRYRLAIDSVFSTFIEYRFVFSVLKSNIDLSPIFHYLFPTLRLELSILIDIVILYVSFIKYL